MTAHVLIRSVVQIAASAGTSESGFWVRAKGIADAVKPFAEVIAYLAAGAFFLYKAAAGYLVTDLTLKLKCHRKRSKEKQRDYLSVVATFKKGEKGALRLYDAQLRVTCPFGNDQPPMVFRQKSPHELIGIDRLTYKDDKIVWLRSTSTPRLNLAPGDSSQFAALCEVPADRPCSVEVVIFGKRWWGIKKGQWRASEISLPNVNPSSATAERSALVMFL